MKWFHWVILACVSVAGLLFWLYMLGSKEDVNKKMERVRSFKGLDFPDPENPKVVINTDVKDPVLNEPTA